MFGGLPTAYLVTAPDAANRATYAALYTEIESSPVTAFAAAGLLGTVLGQRLLAVAQFRTRTGPAWVAPTLWAFLALEFVGRVRSHVDGGVEPVGEPLRDLGQPA